jgi:hypothetical protein
MFRPSMRSSSGRMLAGKCVSYCPLRSCGDWHLTLLWTYSNVSFLVLSWVLNWYWVRGHRCKSWILPCVELCPVEFFYGVVWVVKYLRKLGVSTYMDGIVHRQQVGLLKVFAVGWVCFRVPKRVMNYWLTALKSLPPWPDHWDPSNCLCSE